jgi:serine/threonine-protein kinase
MALRPGERFGRYEIAELLGRGGMGEVYSAHDLVLRRKVALKVLAPPNVPYGTVPPPSGGAGRILREARAAAGIAHPNAVGIYDVGEVEGVPFLAMEFVSGRTLRAFVGDATIPVGRRIRWIADVARALGAAHDLSLVHRDVKPDNVMVREDGLVKVLDFGIARRAVEGERGAPVNLEELGALGKLAMSGGTLTAEGAVVGTPMYMAPEQLRGGALDGRTDQFAWGVLAYEVLSGGLPWEGSGPAVLNAILATEPRPLLERVPELPARVDAVVRKALSKAPEDRFPKMEMIADELEPFASSTATREQRSMVPMRDLELARTEQISVSSADQPVASGISAMTQPASATESRRPPKGALGAGLVVAGIVLGGAWAYRAHLGAALTPPPAPIDASAEVPSRMSSNPDAVAEYRAGLQALRDGTRPGAYKHFSRAVELDPLFGAAQLRLAVTRLLDLETEAIVDTDFQATRTAQASLGTHDKLLLEAFEAAGHSPPELAVARRTLQDATDAHAEDAEYPFALAIVEMYGLDMPRATKAIETSIARDPGFAFAWRTKGDILALIDDADGAKQVLGQCIKVSPGATTCMSDLIRIESAAGDCTDLIATSRKLAAILPDSDVPYRSLAEGLLGSGAAVDAARAALQQAIERTPSESRSDVRLAEDAALATFVGDFARADAAYKTLAEGAASQDATYAFTVAYPRVLIATETRRLADARRIAETYLRVRPGLANAGFDLSLMMQAEELSAGLLAPAEFERERSAWLHRNASVPESQRWITAFALPVTTRESALAALGGMPDAGGPLLNAFMTAPDEAEPIGRTYAQMGSRELAERYLSLASGSCHLLNGQQVIFAMRATLELGRLLEEGGDAAAACTRYERVIARWGHAVPSSTSATIAQERARTLRCTP